MRVAVARARLMLDGSRMYAHDRSQCAFASVEYGFMFSIYFYLGIWKTNRVSRRAFLREIRKKWIKTRKARKRMTSVPFTFYEKWSKFPHIISESFSLFFFVAFDENSDDDATVQISVGNFPLLGLASFNVTMRFAKH